MLRTRFPYAAGERHFRSSASLKAGSNGSGTSNQHVIVVGGGAAGLTAAYFAAESGANVTVLERTREAGKKVNTRVQRYAHCKTRSIVP